MEADGISKDIEGPGVSGFRKRMFLGSVAANKDAASARAAERCLFLDDVEGAGITEEVEIVPGRFRTG